jgi:hypothetical protein
MYREKPVMYAKSWVWKMMSCESWERERDQSWTCSLHWGCRIGGGMLQMEVKQCQSSAALAGGGQHRPVAHSI